MTCTSCKAENCQELFNKALAMEFTDPAYGIVHHLTVPTYYLQHNLYSKKAWLHTRELLRKFIEDDLSPQQARKLNRPANRDHNFTKGEKLEAVKAITWTSSIANVRFHQAEDYCEDIKQWARQVLKDSNEVAL